MWMFDVETLGKDSNTVLLSLACIHFDSKSQPSPDQLRKDTFFVKFNVKDQVKRHKRTMTSSTMDWWNKQCLNVKKKSFIPSSNDVTLEDGLKAFKEWSVSYNDDSWVWARGNLDQLILDSVEEQLGLDPVFHFSRWRDVRTAVDFMYGTTNGYCKVDYPGFDSFLNITKHDPVDDCLLDIMMLLYGKKE